MSVLSKDNRHIGQGDQQSAEHDQVERALIDASSRRPVMAFYSCAILWLLLQTLLSVVTSLKMQWPEFLGEYSFLTYGRLLPLQNNLMIYGWAALAGIGTSIWILTRLCRVALPRPGLLLGGLALWNVGLVVGGLELLAGNGRGFEYLDFPRYVYSIIFIAYSLIAVWGTVIFANRRPGHVYISAWYIVGALFWFPWLLGGANVLLGAHKVQGVMQAVVGAWYAQNIITLWLTAMGLGAIYYLVPKVVGRSVHSYYLATFGFWTFAIFSAWNGLQRLTGGPVPVWMITVSIVASILLLIPVATVTANYVLTMQGDYSLVYHSPTIRFVFFGAIAYTIGNLVQVFGSYRSIGNITQFSWFSVGQDQLFVFAFFSMVMFGAMYYIIPRLVGCEWLSATFIKLHFWGMAYGYGMCIIMLLLGGYAQGAMQAHVNAPGMTNPTSDFLLSLNAVLPYLRGRTIAHIPLCIGQAIFALHFLLMVLRLGRPSGVQPTLFAPIQEGAKS